MIIDKSGANKSSCRSAGLKRSAKSARSIASVALLRGAPIAFDASWPYVVSLLYLSLAGTSLAFGLYLALLKKIGPARAAYTSVLFPVIALVVSTIFEGYRWSLPAFIGLAVLLGGNALALSGRRWLPELHSNQRPTD